ncbi:MAG: universal stress protein [Planctomycetota bacterium]|jgi:nucleotide-binding universal stress UspA family protein
MRVLITTDGSDTAIESIDRYCQLRPAAVSSHTVLTVDELQAYGIIDSVDQAEMDRLQHENCQRILGLAREVLQKHGMEAKYVERAGQAADTILTYAEDTKSDLIVIGARGNGALTRVLLGSTSDSVVSHAKNSVWVVRPSTIQSDPDSPHLTVCYDGSEIAKRAINRVREMEFPSKARITLVSFVRRPENLPNEIVYDQRLLDRLRLELREFQAAFPTDGPKVDILVEEKRHVGHGLVDFATVSRSSLIVVGDKGRSAISRFLIGSVSRFVLHHAPCSVLVLKG